MHRPRPRYILMLTWSGRLHVQGLNGHEPAAAEEKLMPVYSVHTYAMQSRACGRMYEFDGDPRPTV